MALRDWLQRTLPVRDGGEQSPIKTVQLTVDGGVVLETWEAPFQAPDVFFQEIDAVLAQLAEESPKRRVPVMFTAIAPDGAIKSQCPHSITGKNAAADALVGSGNNAAKAYSEAMEGLTRVMKAVLESARVQVESVTKTCQAQAEHIFELHELERERQKAELSTTEQSNGVNAYIGEQLKGALPLLMQAGEVFLNQRGVGAAAASKVSGSAAASGPVATTINGVVKQ